MALGFREAGVAPSGDLPSKTPSGITLPMLLSKAKSSVAAGKLCLEHGHADSAVSRAYYAMFQGAQVALAHAGFHRAEWTHAGLQATFTNELTRRRKILPPSLASNLNRALRLRLTADYSNIGLSLNQAAQVLSWAEEFLRHVEEVMRHG